MKKSPIKNRLFIFFFKYDNVPLKYTNRYVIYVKCIELFIVRLLVRVRNRYLTV